MKANILKIVIGLIFLIVFNVLFFLLGGTERSDTEWVCYGFIHVSYLCLLVTPLFCNAGKGETVLSASLYLRALFYFFIELAIGLGFIWYNAYNPIAILWPVIIQGILLAVFLILQLMSVLANDATKASLAKQRQERVYIRSLAENLKEAMRQVMTPHCVNRWLTATSRYAAVRLKVSLRQLMPSWNWKTLSIPCALL